MEEEDADEEEADDDDDDENDDDDDDEDAPARAAPQPSLDAFLGTKPPASSAMAVDSAAARGDGDLAVRWPTWKSKILLAFLERIV